MSLQYREDLAKSNRIVIKVGTSTLTHENGRMNFVRMDRLSMVISELINRGREVILVSSGSISVGMGKLNLTERPNIMGAKQALAAIGQCELMNIYSRMFSAYNQMVAQILLTKNDVADDIRRQNIDNTFEHLLGRRILPIVNENDTVSIDEIKTIENFGDNDTLSAVVSKLVYADLLIVLSDIDGFYNANPKECPECELIDTVTEVTDEIRNYAAGNGTKRGTGGMVTKLNAAEIVTKAGINMVLANGNDPMIIFKILDGLKIGTLFLGKNS